MKTKLTELLGIKYPIIQTGMQWLAVPKLAAAVSNAGGIGTINVTCWPDLNDFADALDEINSLTSKPYIVNISLAPTQRLDESEILKTIKLCADKHVAAIETSADDPRNYIKAIHDGGMLHFHKCPNYKVSMSMERKGVDGVIIVGYEAGGHPSADGVGTFVIARRCAADLKIPVVAAGGIADGHGLAAALALGADGVGMGTRFVNTTECEISDNHRQWPTTTPQCWQTPSRMQDSRPGFPPPRSSSSSSPSSPVPRPVRPLLPATWAAPLSAPA